MPLPNPGMSFTAFDVLPAADLNDIVENVEALAAGTGLNAASIPNSALASQAWQSWTPTLTNLTLGSGTVVAKYTQVGKTVFFHFMFRLGAGSAVGTGPSFTLPSVPASIGATGSGSHVIGSVHFEDNGVASVEGFIYINAATPSSTAQLVVSTSSGTYVSAAQTTASVPFTFGTGDEIRAQGFYEAA